MRRGRMEKRTAPRPSWQGRVTSGAPSSVGGRPARCDAATLARVPADDIDAGAGVVIFTVVIVEGDCRMSTPRGCPLTLVHHWRRDRCR